ncbi:hypothetical protein D9M68_840270 [compost metagenome]
MPLAANGAVHRVGFAGAGKVAPGAILAHAQVAVEVDGKRAALADQLQGRGHGALGIADARDLAEATIGEAQVDKGGVVGVLLVEGGGHHGADAGHGAAHQENQPIERVNAGGHQHAAAGGAVEVPGLAIAFHPELDESA